jgi:hypothetical protein
MAVLMKMGRVDMNVGWRMENWMEWNDVMKKKKWSRMEEPLFKYTSRAD